MDPLDLESWRLLVHVSYSLALYWRQKKRWKSNAELSGRVLRWYLAEKATKEKEGKNKPEQQKKGLSLSELEEGIIALQLIQSDCLLFLKETKKASEIANGLLSSLPKNSQLGNEEEKTAWMALVHRQLGRCALAEGNMPEGLAEYKKSLQLEGRKGFVWHEMAQIYVHMNLKDAAELCYQQSVKISSGVKGRTSRFVSQLRLAQVLSHETNLAKCKDAIFAVNNALKVKEDSAPAYLLQGVIFAKQGDMKKAKTALQKSLRIDAVLPMTNFYLSVVHENLGDIPSAESDIFYEKDNSPNFHGVYFQLGKVAKASKAYVPAKRLLAEAVHMNPLNETYWNELQQMGSSGQRRGGGGGGRGRGGK